MKLKNNLSNEALHEMYRSQNFDKYQLMRISAVSSGLLTYLYKLIATRHISIPKY